MNHRAATRDGSRIAYLSIIPQIRKHVQLAERLKETDIPFVSISAVPKEIA